MMKTSVEFRQRLVSFSLAVAAASSVAACSGNVNTTPVSGTSVGASDAAVDTYFAISGRSIYESTNAATATAAARSADGTRSAQAQLGQKLFIRGIDYGAAGIGQGADDDPLANGSSGTWSRDLPLMRAMGANAIRVYNVRPPGYDGVKGPITNFLNAAWGDGSQPVYVIITIFFTGDKLLNSGAVSALASQYRALAKAYAGFPALLGLTISNEIGATNFLSNAAWWQGFNTVARAAKQGFADGGDSSKLVMMAEADGNIGAVVAGEQNGAAVDAWGVNVYRGRTFTNLVSQLQATTQKPVLITEYGAPASYHPGSGATYNYASIPPGPTTTASCSNYGSTSPTDVAELPLSGNPSYAGLTDYVQTNATALYTSWSTDGVLSGGYYFEWQDEWWKANGDPNVHTGQSPVAPNGNYPGCYNDESWFGLNSLSAGNGSPSTLNARPTLAALQTVWQGQR
jgi:hypothetical protein